MKPMSYSLNKKGDFIIQVESRITKTKETYVLKTLTEIHDFVENFDYSWMGPKKEKKVKAIIKEIKNMFQVQCLSTYGGPGLGKSTTALNVTADLKKEGINADYTSEVAKEKVYGKNINELRDQSSIIGEQIKRLNNLVKSRDVTIAVQDSPFILGIAYQNKEDPHVDEEDFRKFYVKQYLNYINLNILLKREQGVKYQEEGREQTLEQSVQMDKVIKKDVLQKNNLAYIQLPAYQANLYMVELGKVMDALTIEERYKIFTSYKDKEWRSINYHIMILEKTIKHLKEVNTDIDKIANNLSMKKEEVLLVLREYKNINGIKYVTIEEMVEVLSKALKKLKKL